MFLRSIRKCPLLEGILRNSLAHNSSVWYHGLTCTFPVVSIQNGTLRSQSSTSNNYEIKYDELTSRGLVRISGEKVHEFLQGLMTNDINHLENSSSLYTMFLNTKGRILYDSIIYKYNDILLVECDICDLDNFVKHLKMYRVRRKIDIDIMSDVLSLGVIFEPNQNLSKNYDLNGSIKELEQLVPCSTIYEHDSTFELNVKDLLVDKKNIFIYRDPRLSALG